MPDSYPFVRFFLFVKQVETIGYSECQSPIRVKTFQARDTRDVPAQSCSLNLETQSYLALILVANARRSLTSVNLTDQTDSPLHGKNHTKTVRERICLVGRQDRGAQYGET